MSVQILPRIMVTYKVNVNKLNLRKAPVTDFDNIGNVVGVLRKDAVFECIKVLENELGRWCVGKDGHCVSEKWLLGVEEGIEKPLLEFDYTSFVSNLNFDWVKSKGVNIKIGLLDTGIIPDNNYYNQFKIEVISSNNMILSHGNFIGGVIAGQKKILGLARKSNLISIKYKSNGDSLLTELENFTKGLSLISNSNEPFIINISQGFNLQSLNEKFFPKKEEIVTLVKQISSQSNKLILCAADDNIAINDVLFPACMDECISIGCIDEFSKEISIGVKLNILTPMVTFTSFDNAFNPTQDSGSSYSTAIVSSLAACYISEKGEISKQIFLEELEKFSINRSSFIYTNDDSFQYQIIQK